MAFPGLQTYFCLAMYCKFITIQIRDTGYCAIWSLPTKDAPKSFLQEDVYCTSIEALHDKAGLLIATKATSELQRTYGLASQHAFMNPEQCLMCMARPCNLSVISILEQARTRKYPK